MTYRKTTRTLTIVRVVEEFTEDETPSLPGIVVETTGEDITHVTRSAGLRKCGPVEPERRRKGGAR